MLEIFYECQNYICRASRDAPTQPWSPGAPEQSLSSESDDGSPMLAWGGLSVFIASERPHDLALGEFDIFLSTRLALGASWSTPEPVVPLNSASGDMSVAAGAEPEPVVVFRSDRGGGATLSDLYGCQRRSDGSWSQTKRLNLNTSWHETSPWLDASATLLYFATNRPGGKGNLDIWVATRGDPGAAFGTPQPVGSLNSPAWEEDPWLSSDLRTIYFVSNRNGSKDLFVATR